MPSFSGQRFTGTGGSSLAFRSRRKYLKRWHPAIPAVARSPGHLAHSSEVNTQIPLKKTVVARAEDLSAACYADIRGWAGHQQVGRRRTGPLAAEHFQQQRWIYRCDYRLGHRHARRPSVNAESTGGTIVVRFHLTLIRLNWSAGPAERGRNVSPTRQRYLQGYR